MNVFRANIAFYHIKNLQSTKTLSANT